MEKDIQIKRNKFINDFNKSYNVYLKNKKDYFHVKLMYEHFCQNNKYVDSNIKIVKLKSIINTHRANKNHEFEFDIYKSCEFFWSNLNLYILSTLAIASESSIKRKANDYDKQLDKVALEHLINCEDIVNDLSIGNSYLNKKNKISDLINYFKKFFNDSNSGKV